MSAGAYGGLLDAVRGVHWQARRTSGNAASGTHQSKQRGTSAEFTEFRLYRQGDDPRRVDWKLLARSDRAYIRLATDRTVLPTTLVLDASASMAFPLATRAKWRRAQELVVGLAAVAHADGDPVGIAVPQSSGPTRALQPRTRRGVVAEIARVVDECDATGSAPLASVLAAIHTSRIAVITDLLGDAEELFRAARVHLASGGEFHVVHVVAREELDPPRRPILAADPEQPSVHRLLADQTRAGYDRAFAAWREEMAARWRAAGASYTQVVADEPAGHAIRRITERPMAAMERR